MIIGYISGVFDLFHVGHLNLLKNAKCLCDRLVVAVVTDEDVSNTKGKKPIIPLEERMQIVGSIKYVDVVMPRSTEDKATMCKKLEAAIVFVGDDWYGSDKWKHHEKVLNENGVRVIYLPYTKGVSSTIIREALNRE
jgi:glycerol-3-phosphate cytidylyltransferase